MGNLHVRLNFNLSEEKGIKHNSLKEHNTKRTFWLRNVVKLGKYNILTCRTIDVAFPQLVTGHFLRHIN